MRVARSTTNAGEFSYTMVGKLTEPVESDAMSGFR